MYRPPIQLLDRYADLLVNFALHGGKGVKKREVVQALVPDAAKPMYGALQRSILKAGAFPLMRLTASGFEKDYYLLADREQLTFFPKEYLKARVKLIDHTIGILAEKDLKALRAADPKKIMLAQETQKPYRDWLFDKEYQGRLTWTIGLYGTPAMAKEAGLSLEQYWRQIIEACYLDKAQPVAEWTAINREIDRIRGILNRMRIARILAKGEGMDISFSLGEERQFVGGGGRNIPSYEIFTSPDWHGTNGYITFNQPLYRYGNIIRDIYLEFKHGRVVKAEAKQGQKLLLEMLKRPNADKVGEYSLTDKRFSRITKFMANTLFDENIGGVNGNTHIALGMSYKDAYAGDIKTLTKQKYKQLGLVDSGEHCDIVSTLKRQVDVELTNGQRRTIYANGSFVV